MYVCFFYLTYRKIYTTLANFITKYFVMCNVYTDVAGIKIIPCLSTCTQDNPLAKARGLSSRTGGQPLV